MHHELSMRVTITGPWKSTLPAKSEADDQLSAVTCIAMPGLGFAINGTHNSNTKIEQRS